ncbi:MAG TPA: DUF4190 domain-containing protein [Acidimicrobiia bacterium]|nr:DUF4190 domain-containing protein [Acidimicrobiia bacterium]
MPPCLHCGRELSPRATVCPECGEPGPGAASPASGAAYPPPPPAPAAQPGSVGAVMAAVPRTEPFAIASIVCAVANFFGIFIIGAILGIVFGKMAQKNIAQNPALEVASLARAGIIIGWVGLALVAAFLLLAIAFLGVFSVSTESDVPARPVGWSVLG